MKKFINSLGLILLAAAAGYSAYWYVLANQAETVFKEKLTQWQKENQIESIAYDSLSKEGFPSHINLRLDNVRIKKTELGKAIEGAIDGSLTLSRPLWQGERTITTNGTTTLIGSEEGQSHQPYKLTTKGLSTFTYEDPHANHFDILKKVVFKEEKKETQEKEDKNHNISFVSFKSNLEEMTFSGDINENTPLNLRSGPLNIKVQKKDYKQGQEEITFSYNQKDLTVSVPDSKEILKIFYYNPSQLGKIALEFDGSVCYPEPSNWESISSDPFHPRKAEYCVKVDRAQFTSDLGDSNVQNFILSMLQDETLWTLTLKGSSEGSQTEKYDQEVKKSLAILLKDPEYIKSFVGDDPKSIEKVKEASNDIINLIPALHEYGKITTKIDFVGTADIQNNVTEAVKFDLSAFDYTIPPYSLSLTSKGDLGKNFSDPNVTGLFKITRYKQLVEQLTAFSNKVVQVYNKYGVETGQAGLPLINAENTKQLLTFFKEISEDPAKDTTDLRVPFNFSKGNFKVGTLGLPEFIGKALILYNQLAPQLQESPPGTPAVVPPVPPVPAITQ